MRERVIVQTKKKKKWKSTSSSLIITKKKKKEEENEKKKRVIAFREKEKKITMDLKFKALNIKFQNLTYTVSKNKGKHLNNYVLRIFYNTK